MRSDEGLQRSIYYWRRRPRLDCGCTEPCRCEHRDHPTEKRVDAYRDAVDHLAEHRLAGAALTPECRALCRRGSREWAEAVMRRWSV